MDEASRAQDLIGSNVYDKAGSRIGRVDNVFVDDTTDQPEWVTVRTGLFGTRESFVPLTGASTCSDGLTVTVPKDKVKTAPQIETEAGHLSVDSGHHLYTHYELQHVVPGDEPRDRAETSHEQQAADQQLDEEPDLKDELVGRHRWEN